MGGSEWDMAGAKQGGGRDSPALSWKSVRRVCAHSPGRGCRRDTQSSWTLVPSMQPAPNAKSLSHQEARLMAGQRGGWRPWCVSLCHPLLLPLLCRFVPGSGPRVSMTHPSGETTKAATARPHSCMFMRHFLSRSPPCPKSKRMFLTI